MLRIRPAGSSSAATARAVDGAAPPVDLRCSPPQVKRPVGGLAHAADLVLVPVLVVLWSLVSLVSVSGLSRLGLCLSRLGLWSLP